jgi:glycopeptide antibiotics resistance protein
MQKKIIGYLFISYILFALYNTLLPFDFSFDPVSLREKIRILKWTPYFTHEGRVSLIDIAGNIILFIPFGFLLFMYLRYKKVRYPVLWCVLFGAILSFKIEFFQLFISRRNTAPHDIINNTFGSLVGSLVAAIYSKRISHRSKKLFYDLLNNKPFFLIVCIIGIAQFINAMMPFTVTIAYSAVVKSLKSTNIIPFSYQSLGKLILNKPNRNDLLPFDFTIMIEDSLFWIAIACIIMLCYKLYWNRNPKVKLYLYVTPLLYFFMLESGQLFIFSRTTDINDVISGYGGILLGYLLFSIIRTINNQPLENNDVNLLRLPLFVFFIFILFAGLRPFDWSIEHMFLERKWELEKLIPFYSYYKKHSLWNIFDLINGLLYFMPISLFWSYKLRRKAVDFPSIYFRTLLAGFLLGLLIEFSQLFSIYRVAEITDILTYAVGGGLGAFLVYYYEKEIYPNLEKVISDLRS